MEEVSGKPKHGNTCINGSSSNVYDVVHYFNVKVLNEKRDVVAFLSWHGLRWELRLKYDWYLKYRAALLQVKHPKCQVQCFWGNEPATGKALEEIRRGKIRAKKAKITEYKNKLEKAKSKWTSLFPIEDDPSYKRAVEKIERLVLELRSL